MQQPLNRFLLLQPVWLPTVLFIPLLYALGWLAAVPLTLLGLPTDQLSLTGTVLSFVLFLALMHRWVAVRWSAEKPWAALGICRANPQEQPTPAAALLKGLLIAAGLLTVITSVVLLEGSGDWRGEVDATQLTNAVLLCLGVGFAEEIIFRGWLWAELNQMLGSRLGAFAQASIFSLVHTRFNLGLGAMSGLLIGLFLLGLVLAGQRQSDKGSLWGCIGLHGGLVAGWFLLQSGLLELSPNAPSWLVGPGGNAPNPLGGAVGLVSLLILLLIQRTAVARAARPATGARNAS
ncbi:CPBP family intramembrane glutamic endopeptidase [Synechococcus sp. A15-44]|uniref:CPBP family intramembrane glutamic endopeptidase n=1 Tax=Synechococcus sp. A15-44 TaxID=1050646 RepID=UPI0016451F61|nr:type II CAAX endopeptidase family protein [Synechococcus sp. A15-44]QNI63278.1 CAAX amino terminal protease [Synechococcus sp. A15-44]